MKAEIGSAYFAADLDDGLAVVAADVIVGRTFSAFCTSPGGGHGALHAQIVFSGLVIA
jgi:hypothetical protein